MNRTASSIEDFTRPGYALQQEQRLYDYAVPNVKWFLEMVYDIVLQAPGQPASSSSSCVPGPGQRWKRRAESNIGAMQEEQKGPQESDKDEKEEGQEEKDEKEEKEEGAIEEEWDFTQATPAWRRDLARVLEQHEVQARMSNVELLP